MYTFTRNTTTRARHKNEYIVDGYEEIIVFLKSNEKQRKTVNANNKNQLLCFSQAQTHVLKSTKTPFK